MAEMMYNELMRKPLHFLLLAIIPAAAVIISCTDFFSTSWAPWAARDPNKLIPAITADNVDELIAMAGNDPNLSLAVLQKIRQGIKDSSGDEKLKLQTAALEAAANSVGIGQSVLGAAGQLTNLGGDDPEGMAKDMVISAINGLQNLESTCGALLDSLPMPANPADPAADAAFMAFANKANADDLAMAAVILIAGEAKKQMKTMEPDDYIDELGEKIVDGDPSLTGSENLAQAMAIASVLEDRADEISGPLKDVLLGLKLISKT